MTPHLSRMLGIARDHCVELGYPRNDHLIRHERPPGPLVDDEIYEAIQSRGPVVGYFPTWRDDAMSIPGGDPVVSEMADIVGDQGGVLVYKSHHGSSSRVSSGGSLVVLPATTDLNAYLGICDVLVTDYSSVASDYLLLNRPIVLFAPDIDKYRGSRGFLLSFRSNRDAARSPHPIEDRAVCALIGCPRPAVACESRPPGRLLLGRSAEPGACERGGIDHPYEAARAARP